MPESAARAAFELQEPMGSGITKLSKQSLVYGLGGLASKLLGFVLLPVYTRFLSPAEYGVWSLLLITGSITATIAQMGLGSALFMEVSYREENRRAAEGSALLAILVAAGALAAAGSIFAEPLSQAVFGRPEYARLLRLVLYASLLGSVDVVLLARLRIEGRAGLFSTIAVARFALAAALNIYFIVGRRAGIEGLALASLYTATLFSAGYIAVLVVRDGIAFSPNAVRRMLRFGLPLVPANLAGMILVSGDRYFIEYYTSSTELGLYSLGYNIGLIINLAVQALQLAWPAHMFTLAKRPDAPRQFARLLTYYSTIFGALCLVICVFTREALIILATPQFYGAAKVVPLIAFSYVLYGAVFMTNTGLMLKEKTKYVAIFTAGAAIVNLGLNAVLVPRFGMMGAAWATIAAYAFLLVAQARANLRYLYVPYEYGRLLKVLAAGAMVYLASTLVRFDSLVWAMGTKVALMGLFPASLYLLRFFEPPEHAALRRLIAPSLSLFRSGYPAR